MNNGFNLRFFDNGVEILPSTDPTSAAGRAGQTLMQRCATRADADGCATRQIADRMGLAARSRKLLTYAELVRGIQFQGLPGAQPAELRSMDINGGTLSEVDREIADEIAIFLSIIAYRHASILPNAVIVDQRRQPSRGFFAAVQAVGLSCTNRRDERHFFWASETRRVFDWFKNL